jgi:hypothetical protein
VPKTSETDVRMQRSILQYGLEVVFGHVLSVGPPRQFSPNSGSPLMQKFTLSGVPQFSTSDAP